MEKFTSETVKGDPTVENRTVKINGAKLKELILNGGHLETYILSGSGTTVEQAIVLNDPCDDEDETLEDWGIQARKLLAELSGIKEMKMSGLLSVVNLSHLYTRIFFIRKNQKYQHFCFLYMHFDGRYQ